MGLKKYLTATIAGMGLGILANSYDIQTSEPFKFVNPVPIHSTLAEQIRIVSKRPKMIDTFHTLEFFGHKIPLKTTRKVIDSTTAESYQGILDKNGDIHTTKEVYRLQSAHDSQWYEKECVEKH